MEIRALEKIYGTYSVRAIFLTRPDSVRRVILLDGKKNYLNKEFTELARSVKIEPEILVWKKFIHETGLTKDEKHQGVCIFAEPRKIYSENDLAILRDNRLILALDQISNPQNLATVLRSSAFFG